MSGVPSTGFFPCFLIQGRILVRSKIVPEGVQTGCANGCSEREQKLKGRRLKGALSPPFPPPAPALAEYESPDAHSECVICFEPCDQ